jgi:FAD/FMN-containing dehydrogenase
LFEGLVATAACVSYGLSPRSLRAASSRNANGVDFSALQRSIAGEVIPIDSPVYTATREALTWNMRKTDRKPQAIVRVRSAKDVSAAVRFAAARGLKVAVRGGGHNYFNSPVRNGGLVLDLSALNVLKIDAPNRRASVQPNVKSGTLVSALAPLGLAFPIGHCSDVSLSGFLLNGGIGWNVGEWGPSCMSVRGIELVTASGDIVYADPDHHADLFWAARGAGPGFFGVITRYDLDLRALPRAIGVRSVIFDANSIDDVGDWLADFAAAAPPQMEVICAIGANGAPESAGKPSSSLLVAGITFADSESQGRRWLAPIDSYPGKAKVVVQTPYESATFETLQTMNDADFPNGCRFAADSCWSNATPRQLLSAVRSVAFAAPSTRSFSFFGLNTVRGEPGRNAPDAAFSMWGSLLFGAYGFWTETREDRENVGWVQKVLRAVEPLTVGYYVGEADLAVDAKRASRCFSPSAWARLAALKKQHDPGDVFFSYLEQG